jgi:hypothetical protein
MAEAVPWLTDFALRAGFKYEPEPDERWLRVWEPFVTLRNPIRYEHAVSTTGTTSALTIARFVLAPRDGFAVGDEGWMAVGQDERFAAPPGEPPRSRIVAATSDTSSVFRDEASFPRTSTGDPAFDAIFATFAASGDGIATVLNPSVRKLAIGWQTPIHFEIRPGGYVLAPIALRPDPPSLAWLVDAARVFADKVAK